MERGMNISYQASEFQPQIKTQPNEMWNSKVQEFCFVFTWFVFSFCFLTKQNN